MAHEHFTSGNPFEPPEILGLRAEDRECSPRGFAEFASGFAVHCPKHGFDYANRIITRPAGELAPCCRTALAAFRWWAWLECTISNGESHELVKRLTEAKRSRPQTHVSTKRQSTPHPISLTPVLRAGIIRWIYVAAHPIRGARPMNEGRGRPPLNRIDSYIEIFLGIYARAGGDPTRMGENGRNPNAPAALYLRAVWQLLPTCFSELSGGKIRLNTTLVRRARDIMSGKYYKERACGFIVLRYQAPPAPNARHPEIRVKMHGVPHGAVFKIWARPDDKWTGNYGWSMRPADFVWEQRLIDERKFKKGYLSEVSLDSNIGAGVEFHVRTKWEN